MSEPKRMGDSFAINTAATHRLQSCAQHGTYTSDLVVMGGSDHWTGCPACREDYTREVRQRALEVRDPALALDAAGIPKRFQTAVADSDAQYRVTPWLNDLYAGEPAGALVLCGPVGTGKTHLACALARMIIKRGGRMDYVSALTYGQRIRATWGKRGDETETSILSRYVGSKALVLDELGATNEIDTGIVEKLICARYDEDLLRRTIVCTNTPPADWDKAFGTRAADRIRESCTLIPLTGASRRVPA